MQLTHLPEVLPAIVILITVFFRLRNSGIKERYVAWWIIIALVSVIGSFFPQLLHVLAHTFDIQVPLDPVFFATDVVILLLILRLSVDLSQASERGCTLVEEIAILSSDMGVLRGKITTLEASKDSDSRD